MIAKSAILNIVKSPYTWVVLLCLVLLAVIYFKKVNPFDFFTPPPSSDDVSLSPAELAAADAMARELKEEMTGFNLRRNLDPWRKFMQMTDKLKKGAYQQFSTLYASSGNGTLTQWVSDESNWSDPDGIASRQQVLDTLNRLNLP